MAKIGRNVYATSYCDKLQHAMCNFFVFLDLSIKYILNATFGTALAF